MSSLSLAKIGIVELHEEIRELRSKMKYDRDARLSDLDEVLDICAKLALLLDVALRPEIPKEVL